MWQKMVVGWTEISFLSFTSPKLNIVHIAILFTTHGSFVCILSNWDNTILWYCYEMPFESRMNTLISCSRFFSVGALSDSSLRLSVMMCHLEVTYLTEYYFIAIEAVSRRLLTSASPKLCKMLCYKPCLVWKTETSVLSIYTRDTHQPHISDFKVTNWWARVNQCFVPV